MKPILQKRNLKHTKLDPTLVTALFSAPFDAENQKEVILAFSPEATDNQLKHQVLKAKETVPSCTLVEETPKAFELQPKYLAEYHPVTKSAEVPYITLPLMNDLLTQIHGRPLIQLSHFVVTLHDLYHYLAKLTSLDTYRSPSLDSQLKWNRDKAGQLFNKHISLADRLLCLLDEETGDYKILNLENEQVIPLKEFTYDSVSYAIHPIIKLTFSRP